MKDCKNICDLLPDLFLHSLKIVKAISAGEWQRFSFWPRTDQWVLGKYYVFWGSEKFVGMIIELSSGRD